MITLTELRLEGKELSQQDLEQVRERAVTLFSRYPDLRFGLHSMDSWAEVSRLMEFQASLPCERTRASYCFVKQAFWCMRRPYKSEKLWSQLTESEKTVVEIAMVLPTFLGQMGLLSYDRQVGLDPNDQTLYSNLLNVGMPYEWLTVLRSWREHFLTNGDFKARVLADVRGTRSAIQVLAECETVAGFINSVISKWRSWSTTIALEFGEIARAAGLRDLKRQRVTEELVSETLELPESSSAFKVSPNDAGIPVIVAQAKVFKSLPPRTPFVDVPRLFGYPITEDYDRFLVKDLAKAWAKVTRKYFFVEQEQESNDPMAWMKAYGYGTGS